MPARQPQRSASARLQTPTRFLLSSVLLEEKTSGRCVSLALDASSFPCPRAYRLLQFQASASTPPFPPSPRSLDTPRILIVDLFCLNPPRCLACLAPGTALDRHCRRLFSGSRNGRSASASASAARSPHPHTSVQSGFGSFASLPWASSNPTHPTNIHHHTHTPTHTTTPRPPRHTDPH